MTLVSEPSAGCVAVPNRPRESTASDANPGVTITQVAFYYVNSSGSNVLLGYGTQSSPGVWTFTFTVNLAPGSYTLLAQATDSDGVLGDPFALTLTVQ